MDSLGYIQPSISSRLCDGRELEETLSQLVFATGTWHRDLRPALRRLYSRELRLCPAESEIAGTACTPQFRGAGGAAPSHVAGGGKPLAPHISAKRSRRIGNLSRSALCRSFLR